MTAYSSFSSLMMKHRRRWRHKRTKRIRQLPLLRSEWMMVIATIERGAVATRSLSFVVAIVVSAVAVVPRSIQLCLTSTKHFSSCAGSLAPSLLYPLFSMLLLLSFVVLFTKWLKFKRKLNSSSIVT